MGRFAGRETGSAIVIASEEEGLTPTKVWSSEACPDAGVDPLLAAVVEIAGVPSAIVGLSCSGLPDPSVAMDDQGRGLKAGRPTSTTPRGWGIMALTATPVYNPEQAGKPAIRGSKRRRAPVGRNLPDEARLAALLFIGGVLGDKVLPVGSAAIPSACVALSRTSKPRLPSAIRIFSPGSTWAAGRINAKPSGERVQYAENGNTQVT